MIETLIFICGCVAGMILGIILGRRSGYAKGYADGHAVGFGQGFHDSLSDETINNTLVSKNSTELLKVGCAFTAHFGRDWPAESRSLHATWVITVLGEKIARAMIAAGIIHPVILSKEYTSKGEFVKVGASVLATRDPANSDFPEFEFEMPDPLAQEDLLSHQ